MLGITAGYDPHNTGRLCGCCNAIHFPEIAAERFNQQLYLSWPGYCRRHPRQGKLFPVFAVCLAAFLSTSAGRGVILSRKFMLSIVIALAISSPYLHWMYTNQDIVFSSSHKFKRGLEHYYLHGSWSLVSNSFLFLTPFWFICLATFPGIITTSGDITTTAQRQIINRYMIFFFLILLAVVLLFKVTYVKDRWLQPLLFAAPLFAFSRIGADKISAKKFKIYTGLAAATCIAVYLAFTLRVVAASPIGNFSRLNYPFGAIKTSLEEIGWQSGLILSDNRFLAGNLRVLFPDSTAIVPDYHFEQNAPSEGPALVVWRADHSRIIPNDLEEFIENTYGINPELYPQQYIEHPYSYGTKTVKMGWILLNLSSK